MPQVALHDLHILLTGLATKVNYLIAQEEKMQKVVKTLTTTLQTVESLLTQEASSTEILAHRDQAIQASLKAAQERTKKSMWSTIHIPSDAPTPADPQDHGQQTC